METEAALSSEMIALNNKKVAMALDDLIKLSKSKANVMNKGKKPRRQQKDKTYKVQHYMNSLSTVRVKQGAIAKRRSNFQGNQYPVTRSFAGKGATAAPFDVRGRGFNTGKKRTSANQSRLITPPAQNRSVQATFIAKRQKVVDEKVENRGWRRKTLDSRFAIMKEQRKTHQSNNNHHGDRVQVPRLPPWARARRFLH